MQLKRVTQLQRQPKDGQERSDEVEEMSADEEEATQADTQPVHANRPEPRLSSAFHTLMSMGTILGIPLEHASLSTIDCKFQNSGVPAFFYTQIRETKSTLACAFFVTRCKRLLLSDTSAIRVRK